MPGGARKLGNVASLCVPEPLGSESAEDPFSLGEATHQGWFHRSRVLPEGSWLAQRSLQAQRHGLGGCGSFCPV